MADERVATVSAILSPRLVDRAGAAAYLAVSKETLDRLIQTGKLHVCRLPVERGKHGRGVNGSNRRVLLDLREIDRLIEISMELDA